MAVVRHVHWPSTRPFNMGCGMMRVALSRAAFQSRECAMRNTKCGAHASVLLPVTGRCVAVTPLDLAGVSWGILPQPFCDEWEWAWHGFHHCSIPNAVTRKSAETRNTTVRYLS